MKALFTKLTSAIAILLLLMGALPVQHAMAAGYTVDSLDDTIANDGFCTLREAIEEANNGANTDCAGSPSALADTITFSVSGTITLGATLPNIVAEGTAGALTIDGTGQNIIISGDNTVQVMVVNGGANLTLQYLTIANGNSADYGGGVFNSGTLAIISSAFSGNSAGNSGGGVYNGGGTLNITKSVFSNNSAVYGGGVFHASHTMTIRDSAFSSNNASVGGGGVYNISNATIVNSSFSNNTAFGGGGVVNDGSGTLYIINNTLSGNNATGTGGGGGVRVLAGSVALRNTIVSNSANGDCVGSLFSDTNNLIEDSANACGLINGANGNIVGVDPNLGALTGSPAYFPLNAGSPAIDAGNNAICANFPVNGQSQNGVARPQDGNNDAASVCDIGSYEKPDDPPAVSSIVRADPNPTGAASVNFTVTFSEDVTGVDSGDFTPTVTSGSITGASVTGVTPVSASVYTVTVNTGTGNGMLRLDLNASGTGIQDMIGNSIASGFNTGEEYNVQKLNISLRSVGTYDGFVLESGENTSAGGSANASGFFLYAGDHLLRRQYVSFLHFDTSSLPDTAVVTGITLQVKQYRIAGVNPFTVLGNLQVDIANPFFGTAVTLAPADFQAPAGAANVGAFNPTPLSGGWYQAALNPSAFPLINLTGATQFRLAFSLDDNNDSRMNAVLFYSGNHPTTSYRPVLIVEYYVP